MGLGKTLLALEEFQRADLTRLVVVAPNSFKRGWQDEIEKHGFSFRRPRLRLRLESQRQMARQTLFGAARSDRQLRGDPQRPPYSLKLLAWMRIKPTMLVLDESIQIKTHDSLQTKAALALAGGASLVRLLTGRPQTQGPHDLYPQLRALGLFHGRQKFWAFRNTFCVMGGWENKQVHRRQKRR